MQSGRYYEGKKFGKWETFYPNGRRASETFYHSAPFVNSVWDSTGTQLVVDGNGREVHRYPDGVVALEGEYRHGRKEGVWYGRYPGGELHFEETYNNGILVSGRSRSPSGETFVYDETSLSPMPEGGFQQFYAYLKSSTARVDEEMGHVNLSFRVTKNGVATEVTVDQSASPFLDAKACEILQQGPRWLPARMHGHEPVEGEAFVQVAFY